MLPRNTRISGPPWGISKTIPWASIGPASYSVSARSCRSATGPPISLSCSAFSPPRIFAPQKWRPSLVPLSKCWSPSLLFCPGFSGLQSCPCCTVVGVLISVGTAYLVMSFASIMDYVQALFSFFIAPLFGTVILGMLWKRSTGPGGFWGLLAGTLSSIGMWAWVKVDPAALRYVALSANARDMAENMYRALWSWIVCVVVTIAVSYLTKPRSDAELNGLVYGVTAIPREAEVPIYHRPTFWATVVAVLFVAANILFW